MNKKYVPIELIKYELSKIRKHSNFNYKKAIDRNKSKRAKNPPLLNLLDYLRSKNYSENEIEEAVKEYWLHVEKNNNFEIDIERQIKMKYKGKG